LRIGRFTIKPQEQGLRTAPSCCPRRMHCAVKKNHFFILPTQI
jgi:hypothetical protein